MQTIVVFHDHSQQSHHAVRYALHLARKIKANVLITDAIIQRINTLVPQGDDSFAPDGRQPAFTRKLVEYCNKVEEEVVRMTLPGGFMPAIYGHSDHTEIKKAVEDFESCLDIAYIIISADIYYGTSSILPGRNLSAMLNAAKSPVILIPDNAPIRYAEKYAFVNDISRDNSTYLDQLAKLAAYSAASLMLVNINNGRPLNTDQEHALNSIMTETINKVDYGRIYYRYIPNNIMKSDVQWLLEDNKFEALAIVNDKTNIYKKLLVPAFSEEIWGSINVPLVIYPA